MRFALLSEFLRTRKLAVERNPAAPKRAGLVSALSFALLLSLGAPQAQAATKACKEGVKAAIEGEVREMSDAGNRIFLYVDDYTWDCAHFYVVVTKAQAKPCMDGGHARAKGTLTRKDPLNMDGFWTLTDESAGKRPRMTRSFSCTGRPAGNAKPESKSK